MKEIVGDSLFTVIGNLSGESLKIKVNSENVDSTKINELQNGWKTSLENQLGVE
jgi:hypothetical protein